MDLDFAFFADAAMVAENGLFNVLAGGLDVLRAPGFPATKQAMALVVRIATSAEECGREHAGRVTIIGPSGEMVAPEVPIRFEPRAHPRDPRRGNWTTIVIQYHAVTFPVPGMYVFQLSIGDRPLGRVHLDVVAEGS
jgi:hypothetical protein